MHLPKSYVPSVASLLKISILCFLLCLGPVAAPAGPPETAPAEPEPGVIPFTLVSPDELFRNVHFGESTLSVPLPPVGSMIQLTSGVAERETPAAGTSSAAVPAAPVAPAPVAPAAVTAAPVAAPLATASVAVPDKNASTAKPATVTEKAPANAKPSKDATPKDATTKDAKPKEAKPEEPTEVESGAAMMTVADIQGRIKEIEAKTDLEEELKAELLKRFGKSLEWLNSADESSRKAAELKAEIENAPQLIKELKKQLALPSEDADKPPSSTATVAELEQTRLQAETLLAEAREKLTDWENRAKRRAERKPNLPKTIDDVAQQLDAARKAPTAVAAEAPELALARRTETQAHQHAREQELALLRTELLRYDALAEVFPARREIAQRNFNRAEKQVDALKKFIADRRQAESRRQAEEARRELAQAHPAVRELAERNAALAEERTKCATTIKQLQQELKVNNDAYTRISDDFKSVNEKVRIAGLTTAIGLHLRKQRASLSDSRSFAQRIRFVEAEIPRVQLQLMALEDERSLLDDSDESHEQAMSDLSTSVADSELEDVAAMVRDLQKSRRKYLDDLISDYETYLKDLGELDLSLRKLRTQTSEFAAFIDEHVLWIRSADLLSYSDVGDAWTGMVSLAAPSRWIQTGSVLVTDAATHPAFAGLALLVLAAAWIVREKMRRRLSQLGREVSKKSANVRFLATLEALGWSLFRAAVGPACVWFLAWRLEAALTATDFTETIARGLKAAAILYWTLETLREICRDDGLADMHFDWPENGLRILRKNLMWLMLAGSPLVVLFTMSDTLDGGAWCDSLGRLSVVSWLILLSLFAYRTLHPRHGALAETLTVHPDGLLPRLRFLWFPLACLAPLGLAAIAIGGYVYTSEQLIGRLEMTIWLVTGMLVGQALVLRWLLLTRRKMAVKQAQERAAAAERMAEQCEGLPEDEQEMARPQESELDLQSLNTQMKSLLKGALSATCLLVMWGIWSDVLPALGILDRIELWQSVVPIAETVTNPDGKEITQTVDTIVATTLAHLLLSLLIVSGTVLASRNLPGLLEMAVLQKLPMDRGGRHAITTICRYVLTLTGFVLAFRMIGVGWSSVQWLVAAMTVGLGFGLQEIFANFVSGLIILFERPIRVGDLVTVGGLTGNVTRLQIRATTITDFDRRELIVPNKKFITDDVINWTLSDPVTRVVIPVGVAYGSDTTLVYNELLRAAQQHPIVMEDPAPSALFAGFGDSTLDFQLRVFIPTRDTYRVVVHELNSTIDNVFREKGIEISFPQRDIHIRSIEQVIPLQAEAAKKRAA